MSKQQVVVRPLDKSINPDDIVTDYGGLPLKRADVLALRDQCNRHLRMAPWKLAEFGNYVIAKQYPGMAKQITYHREDFE